ncbi:MAG: hypothetical protein M3R46_09930, partial [Actinomycetota bacterium]|nr:hypothetical protein [Actinomycetota bacterium]
AGQRALLLGKRRVLLAAGRLAARLGKADDHDCREDDERDGEEQATHPDSVADACLALDPRSVRQANSAAAT